MSAGAAAYRRWRAGVRRRRAAGGPQDGRGETAFAAYAAVLLALMYGPMGWTLLARLGAAAPAGPWAGGELGVAAFAAACVLAVLAARAGAPLWTDRREVAYALSGQFPPRVVLRARAVALLLGCGLVAALGTAAVVAGGRPPAGDVVAWAVLAALLAPVPLALGVAAQVPALRRPADVLAAAAAAVGALALVAWPGGAEPVAPVPCLDAAGAPVPCPWRWADAGPGLAGLVPALGAAVLCAWLLLRVLPGRLDVDDAAARRDRVTGAGLGLAAGDALAAGRAFGPARPRARGARGRVFGPFGGGRLLARAPVVARDLLGLGRRRGALAVSLVAGLVGAALFASGVAAATGAPAGEAGGAAPAAPGFAAGRAAPALVAGALLLYGASGTWASGLRALGRQPVPGGLLPWEPRGVLARHAVTPALVGLLVLASGALAAGVAGPATGGAPVGALLLAVPYLGAVLAARAWTAGATLAPAGLFVPVPTPLGDLSVVSVAAWYLRGWLVVAATAWLGATTAGPDGPAWSLPLAVAAALAWAASRRAERVR